MKKNQKENQKVSIETMTGVGKKKKIAGREYYILPVNIMDMHYIMGNENSDENLVILDKKKLDSGDDDIIKEVTKVYDNNLLNNYRGTLLKLSLDFDGDGSIETIYRFTNFKLDIMDYTVKTYLVLVRNNAVIDTISSSNSDVFEIMEVIDLDNDGKKEVVIGKDVVDIPTFYSCYQIYKINDNDLKIYQDCLFEK